MKKKASIIISIIAILLLVVGCIFALTKIKSLYNRTGSNSKGSDSSSRPSYSTSEEGSTEDWRMVVTTSYFTESVEGSTGWVGVKDLGLYTQANDDEKIATLDRGTAFVITEAVNSNSNWWGVELSDGTCGYLESSECMINLPDVLPNIDYNITNASTDPGSIFVSSGYNIDGITGEQLYSSGKVMNSKLGYEEYLVPVMWKTAQRIAVAYHNVYDILSEGSTGESGNYTLRIYDAFRPLSVTEEIYEGLTALYNSNDTVKSNINKASNGSSWGKSWFLASRLSTHNIGVAIDVTIVKKDSSGDWEDLDMPTEMHELSTKAIKYKSGYSSGSDSQTPENYVDSMTTDAMLLDAVCCGYTFTYKNATYDFEKTGLDGLSSEWWHFQDNSDYSRLKGQATTSTDFQVTECLSR